MSHLCADVVVKTSNEGFNLPDRTPAFTYVCGVPAKGPGKRGEKTETRVQMKGAQMKMSKPEVTSVLFDRYATGPSLKLKCCGMYKLDAFSSPKIDKW